MATSTETAFLELSKMDMVMCLLEQNQTECRPLLFSDREMKTAGGENARQRGGTKEHQMYRGFIIPAVASTTVKALTIPASTTAPMGRGCPMFYYYHHGTENCEFCRDICCNAKLKGTTKQCQSLCPEYAKFLDSAQKLPEAGTGQSTGQQSPAWSLPLFAHIALPLAVYFLLLLLLLGLIYSRRHTLAGLFRPRSQAKTSEDPDHTSEPLRAESVQPDTDSREMDLSVEAGQPESPRSSSSSSRVGLPTAVGPLGSSSASVAVQTASYHHPSRGQPEPLGSAVSESLEGREGHALRVVSYQ